MRTWSFYDSATGLFAGRKYSGPDSTLARNTPDGFVAIEGAYDRFAQRVDLESGLVIDDDTLGTSRRSGRERDATLLHIAALEAKQLRPMRELMIDPGNQRAKLLLMDIETAIQVERAKLKRDL